MASNSQGNDSGGRRRSPLQARRPASPPTRADVSPRPARPAGLEERDGQWMTQQAAARAAGVTVAVVRGWRSAGTIAERPSPQRSGSVEVFLTPSHGHGPGHPPDQEENGTEPRSELGVLVPLEIHQQSLAELILRLTDTTERAVRAEARVEALETRLAEMTAESGVSGDTLRPPPPGRRKKG